MENDLRPALECNEVERHSDLCVNCGELFECTRKHELSTLCDTCRFNAYARRVMRLRAAS